MQTTVSGMTGSGSIRHNNREFTAENVDRSRTEENVIFCREDLRQVYRELFDEPLAAYNAKKTKTRDKIADYYEHIRQSKQEKLFHEAIFQIGNREDCGCGTAGGEQAAQALREFAEGFQERNPHLRVFNMVLHMDEATPHLHVDFVPVATEQSRGLETRVSLKRALLQQGYKGVSRKQTEWNAWIEGEKQTLTEIAGRYEFEIIFKGGGRPHMDLPEFKEASRRLEAVQEQVMQAEQELEGLEDKKKALSDAVGLLEKVEKARVDLEAIQPEKGLGRSVKGVTVGEVEQLKAVAIRETAERHRLEKLEEENRRLQSKIPSTQERLAESRKRQTLEQENRRLGEENTWLKVELAETKGLVERMKEGIAKALEFLEEHLPEPFQPLLDRAKDWLALEGISIEPEQEEPEQKQERGWGGMEL